jgi:hypothetical protein
MPHAEYLRKQAEACRRLARSTFDLATAERLRFLAAELSSKADELDDEDTVQPHMMADGFRNGSTGESNRD